MVDVCTSMEWNQNRMAMSKKHNGFTNYETWLVSVWGYTELMTETCKENEHPADDEWCKEFFEQSVTADVPRNVGAVSDLYLSALENIDWRDIANHVNDNLKSWKIATAVAGPVMKIWASAPVVGSIVNLLTTKMKSNHGRRQILH